MTDGAFENTRLYIRLRSSEGSLRNGKVGFFAVFFSSSSLSSSLGYVEGYLEDAGVVTVEAIVEVEVEGTVDVAGRRLSAVVCLTSRPPILAVEGLLVVLCLGAMLVG